MDFDYAKAITEALNDGQLGLAQALIEDETLEMDTQFDIDIEEIPEPVLLPEYPVSYL